MSGKVTCPSCGEENYPTDVQCMSCGANLKGGAQTAPAAGPPPPPAPAGRMPVPRAAGPPGAPPAAVPGARPAAAAPASGLTSEVTGRRILAGLAGGMLPAILLGVVWAFIAVKAKVELGLLAWIIGMGCGFGVAAFSQARGLAYQVIGMGCSVVGILIGKLGIVHAILQQIGDEATEAQGRLGPLVYLLALPATFSLWDILWVGLALSSAYKLLSAEGQSK